MKLTVPPKRAVNFSAPTAILMETKLQQEDILHQTSFDLNSQVSFVTSGLDYRPEMTSWITDYVPRSHYAAGRNKTNHNGIVCRTTERRTNKKEKAGITFFISKNSRVNRGIIFLCFSASIYQGSDSYDGSQVRQTLKQSEPVSDGRYSV